jgi:hypothetical protein
MTAKIFESPDHGATVFERMTGSLIRTEIINSKPRYLSRWHEFRDICRIAEKNVTLNNALEKAEMLYLLIKDGKN